MAICVRIQLLLHVMQLKIEMKLGDTFLGYVIGCLRYFMNGNISGDLMIV